MSPYMTYLLRFPVPLDKGNGGSGDEIVQRAFLLAYRWLSCGKANMAASLLEQRVGNKLQFLRCTVRATRRQLCTVATKEKQEAHQTGIPLIVPPHVFAKAFIVHPWTTSAFDASSKYQWLTKTKLF